MADNLDILRLQINQQNQVLEQYRTEMYNATLRFNLLQKILEDRGVLVKGEFDSRWPQYLRSDIGVVGPDGMMDGSLKVSKYWEKRAA